jgi:hypothetical protein
LAAEDACAGTITDTDCAGMAYLKISAPAATSPLAFLGVEDALVRV